MIEQQQKKRSRVKVKRIGIRGDEVAILFFSVVFLVFLFISFFRLFAVGKLFDDFIFTFLFGWTKYAVYLFLFIILLPIFFNFYFRIKFSFVLGIFFTFFILSWFVQNIYILDVANNKKSIWNELYFYQFTDLSNYFNEWWDTTIINNYYGFFAQPISFADWTSVQSFFPTYAAGGIIANFLIYATAFGGFASSFTISAIFLFVGLSWVLLSKPWLLLMIIFFFLLPIIKIIKKNKINRISEKSSQHKNELDQAEQIIKQPVTTKSKQIAKQEPESVIKPTIKKEPSKEIILQDVIQESGTLAPFGHVNSGKKIQDESDEK